MIDFLIVCVCAILSFATGIFVVSRDISKPLNIAYGVATLSFLVIAIANYLTIHPNEYALQSMRVVVAATTVGVGSLYFLAILLRSKDQYRTIRSRSAVMITLITIAVAILDLTPLVFARLETGSDSPVPVPSYGIVLFVLHFIFLIALAVAILLSSIVHNKGSIRLQHTFVLVGIVPILFFAPLTSIVLPVFFHITDFIILSPLYTVFFVLMVAYAIVKHRLFDIKLAAVRSMAYVLALGALAGIYYGLAYIVSVALFKGETTSSLSVSPVNILLALVLAFIFQPIKQFFDQLTDNIFYRDRYKTDDFFARISELLGSTTDLRGLIERASEEIASTLKAEQAYFFLYYNNDIPHHMSAGTRYRTKMPIQDARLLDEYTATCTEGILITDTLEAERDVRVRRMLVSHKIALVMPLRYSGHLIGYVLLGEQRRDGLYSKRDLKVLTTIADQLVIGIQNALSIHAVKEVNANLQQRIDVATKELRSTNAQLRHLDETKDEFMSMASHQLRTPLTSVKGYISMVLEGDVGKITSQQRLLLEEAFNSSERMVRLIADFLNVSRLQTGKFVIEKHPTDIAAAVRDEVESLQLIAKTHGHKLELVAKNEELLVVCDEAKVRQVIMNFIDNAIYYTKMPGGVIKVAIEKSHNDIMFTVKDSGIGVPESEQLHLFTKFFRAKNARQQRPDGTGVGLFLAKKVITAHGGKMIFSSAEGKGSTFGFYLPIGNLRTAREANHLGN